MPQRPTCHTARLVLRLFELADARGVQRLAGEKAVADTTANIPHPYLDGMAKQWIATHHRAKTVHCQAIKLTDFFGLCNNRESATGSRLVTLDRERTRGVILWRS
jgi:hypothetical protein